MIHDNSKKMKGGSNRPVLPEEMKLKHNDQKNEVADHQSLNTLSTKPIPKATARKSQSASVPTNIAPSLPPTGPKHNDSEEILNSVMQLKGHTFSCPNCDKDFATK